MLGFLTAKRGLAPNSIRLVVGRYNSYQKWLTENKIPHGSASVERFIYELKLQGLRNNTINSYIYMFKEVQEFYKDRGLLTEDFASKLKTLDKNSRPIEILTPEEIESILNASVPYGKMISPHMDADAVTERLNGLYRVFTRFLATTGCRFSEAAKLRVRYVDLGSGRVTFTDTKTQKNRNVWITDPLLTEIRELVEDKNLDELVFTNIQGKSIIPQNYGLHLHRIKEQLHIKKRLHPHVFRHSFITQLLMSGVSIESVATLVGHSDVQTTFSTYAHLADETLKKAIYHHPLVQKNINPVERIHHVEQFLDCEKFESDNRMGYTKTVSSTSITFTLSVKAANT